MLLGLLAYGGGTGAYVETAGGRGAGPALERRLAPYGVRLPGSPADLVRAEVGTWYSNELFLQLTTTPAGVRALLRANALDGRPLRPAVRRESGALPRDHWSRRDVGGPTYGWAPGSWDDARRLSSRGLAPNGSTRYVDVLVARLGPRREVFLRMAQ